MNNSNILISSDPEKNLLTISGETQINNVEIFDANGQKVDTPVLSIDTCSIKLDAASLKVWTPDTPVLYTAKINGSQTIRFGYTLLRSFENREILLNGKPFFIRGYIRGIVAHDHPNMTGLSRKEYHLKNIRQAKKYGFNAVRFHSTIPDEDFVESADELGLLIHMEIGFAYNYDAQGKKQGLALDNQNWIDTIKKYRNHPSAAIFCIGNEMHNSGKVPGVKKLYDTGKSLAPDKLIMDNSGWGEFDRTTADVYSQHVAYFFPFKHHQEMFNQDFFWHMNGSAHSEPMSSESVIAETPVKVRRYATPLKPVLAHEAIHYIDIPDYEALNRKFDAFSQSVTPEYLAANHIEKPRYLKDLPELIRQKKLTGKMPDYQLASQLFKKMGLKIYLERLRLSHLCGFEMLQFADCLKYENKNGIVDFFDDDKYIDSNWMKEFNDSAVLLADFETEVFHHKSTVKVQLFLSNFTSHSNLKGDLKIYLEQKNQTVLLYRNASIMTVSALQKLLDLEFEAPGETGECRLKVEFETSEYRIKNSWKFWVYQVGKIQQKPHCRLDNSVFSAYVNDHCISNSCSANSVLTDRLDEDLFNDLAQGKTVLLIYDRAKSPKGQYQLPAVLDRFKPCIWDRGSNLGGIIYEEWLQKSLGTTRYFDLFMQGLIEGGYKINLDHVPQLPDEWISGVDKPVRDRMKGLIHQRKDFIDDDTLRNFGYLFAWKIGAGKLIISSFSTEKLDNPAVENYYVNLINQLEKADVKSKIEPEILKNFMKNTKIIPEDVMNHFWEIDNKMVEDTLFWEQTGIDLSKLK